MRPAHLLKKVRGSVMPEHIIFVDTETTQSTNKKNHTIHSLMLGVAIYYRNRRDGKKKYKEVFRFEKISEFWEFVQSKKLPKTILYLVSHNAVFDFTVLQHITNLSKMNYKCQFVYEGGVTFISKWQSSNHSIMILDNSNHFAGKLKEWGKELKLPKLKMPEYTSDKERWFVYCERDCEILYHLFVWYNRFLSDNNLGNWKFTIASSAFSAYRHRFMSHNIYIPDNEQETKLARESYHGGRCEVFRKGEYNENTYYKLDVNSMYPYVMAYNEYPTSFDGYYENPNKKKIYRMLNTKAIIAFVQLDTRQPYFVCSHITNPFNCPTGTLVLILLSHNDPGIICTRI